MERKKYNVMPSLVRDRQPETQRETRKEYRKKRKERWE